MFSTDLLLFCTLSAFSIVPVSGVVVDADGKPTDEAEVFLTPYLDEISPPLRATTGLNGEFRFDEAGQKSLSAGNAGNEAWQVVAYKPGVGIATTVLTGAASPEIVSLRLEPTAPVRIQVFDPNGTAVADVPVRLTNFTSAATRKFVLTRPLPDLYFQARTNADGEAVLDVMPANLTFSVQVQTEAFGVQSQLFSGTAKVHALHLRPVGKLRGKLKADGVEDLAGAAFDVVSAPSGADDVRHGAHGLAEVRTNGRGEFEIPALAAGDVRILNSRGIRKSRLFLSKEVKTSLAAGELKQIELPALRGIRLWGSAVEDGDDVKPVPGVVIALQVTFPDADRSRDPRLNLSAISDRNGAFECIVPAEGTLSFMIREVPAPFLKPQLNHRPIPLAAESEDVQIEPIRFARGVPLSGTVVDEMNLPVARVMVRANWSGRSPGPGRGLITSNVAETAETNAHGEFTFAAVTDAHEITLQAEGPTRGSMEAMKLDPEEPENRKSVRLVIEPAGMITIEGRVVDDQGAPVPGVELRLSHSPQLAGRIGRATPVSVRFKEFAKIISDAEGKFTTPHSVTRLQEYSVQVVPRGYKSTSVGVPAPDKSSSRVTLPDIVVTPVKK